MSMMMALLAAAQRAPSIAATSSASASASSQLTISKPSGVGSGTLLIAFIVNYNKRVSPPSGWTELFEDYPRSVHYKFVDSSDPSSYTWTFEGSTASQGFIVALSGGGYDAIGALGSASSSPSAPTVTATSANSLALCWFSENDPANISYSTPSGWTALVADNTGSGPSSAIFYKQVSAGATGAASSTSTPSSTSRGIQIVVKPR